MSISQANACFDIVLDKNLMPMAHKLTHAARGESDAVFLGLDLLRNSDDHGNKRSSRQSRSTGSP
jgi:hypothetical protein